MNKQLICEAFCEALDIRPVPVGFAVKTPYIDSDGDPLLLYFVRDELRNRWKIEDDGTRVPWLEACGVDISGKARGDAFSTLLNEYDAFFDQDTKTIYTAPLNDSELGAAAIKFSALLLRLQDMALLSPQIVRSTFRDDAIASIHASFAGVARVEEYASIGTGFIGHEADVVISAKDAPPLAVYLATSEERTLQALVIKMEAEKYRHVPATIVLLVERAKANPVKETTYSLAMSRLDAVLSYREATDDTMQRLRKLAQINGNSQALQ